jgi:hypothetical protein
MRGEARRGEYRCIIDGGLVDRNREHNLIAQVEKQRRTEKAWKSFLVQQAKEARAVVFDHVGTIRHTLQYTKIIYAVYHEKLAERKDIYFPLLNIPAGMKVDDNEAEFRISGFYCQPAHI